MQKKILVIDDSPTALKLIKNFLEDYGYIIITAASGKKGIEKAMSENPDLALIDTILPDLDGFEVSREIKKQNAEIKIIIMTGAINSVDAAKIEESGADDYCAKTDDLSGLIEAVKRLL